MDSPEYDYEIPQLVNVVVAVMRVTHLKEAKLAASREAQSYHELERGCKTFAWENT